jgi:hypothetical protein
MMTRIEGKGGISATVIADSISSIDRQRITTFELDYPRFILSQVNTHRQLARNAASTRAIPLLKQIEIINENPAMPISFGSNKSGMQAGEELNFNDQHIAKSIINDMMDYCSEGVEKLEKLGLHKQHAGRYIEPWSWVKGVATATEFNNFFHLRSHEDAQPEIKELSDCMKKALEESEPFELSPGEWHTPYIGHMRGALGELWYYVDDEDGGDIILSLEDALKVSASCCAQVSFRTLDTSIDKAKRIYKMLIESDPPHASVVEHQATPMELPTSDCEGLFPEEGHTQLDVDDNYWSGNFKGWIQSRQLIPNHTKRG